MFYVAYKGPRPVPGDLIVPYAWTEKNKEFSVWGPFVDEDTAKWACSLPNRFSLLTLSDEAIAGKVKEWVKNNSK